MSNQTSSEAFWPEPFQAARAAAFCAAMAASKPARSTPEPCRPQRILGQVVGKAEGVVELEGRLAGQRAAGRQPDRSPRRAACRPSLERLAEARFLAQQRFLDQRPRADQLGIGRAHLRDERADEPVHQRLARAEQVGVAHGAAHDPAQHIAAALIGGQHAVRNQEARRAQMVGDDAMAGACHRPRAATVGQRDRLRRSAP